MPFPFTIIRCSLFQSTHPRGVRLFVIGSTTGQSQFQSTHPRGVRRGIANRILQRNSFNPRTHEGCDGYKGLSRTAPLFQSTHPRGVRPKIPRPVDYSLEFQSTHPRGVRLQEYSVQTDSTSFNPRTHEGCDPIDAVEPEPT